jgi:MarR family transcriptional regulator for hemolysin
MKPMSILRPLLFFERATLPEAARRVTRARCAGLPDRKTYCAYYKLAYYIGFPTAEKAMPPLPDKREIAFTIMDVARLLKTYADQRGRQFGTSRAQWAVLVRIERSEGLKQSELAEMLDLQPISLTRMLDRLADNGLIERRPDPNDRRANRLYLTAAARPLLEQLAGLGQEMMEVVLGGLDERANARLLRDLAVIKDSLRSAIGRHASQPQAANG